MKTFLREYINIIINVLCTLLFSLGFYYFLLNAFHASAIDKKVSVGTSDVFYTGYVDNIAKIKDNLSKYNYNKNKYNYSLNLMERMKSDLDVCVSYMENNETILVNNKQTLSYIEVNNINNYFINNLIDKCFTANISWILYNEEKNDNYLEKVSIYKKTNVILGNNANYIKQELSDNSSYYYNTAISNAMVRNNLSSSYQMIVHNYYDFSDIIVGVSEYIARGDNNG